MSMNNDTVIEVKNVSKAFSKNYKSQKIRLKNMLKDTFRECQNQESLAKDEFWALKDISFSIKKNEKVAIMGPNGSGKSTLLKMLNGIYMPSQGEITVNGNISSILELSSGFKPELSGLENIYLKFALLGKKKEEIAQIVDEIIAFSELGSFMETPLKHYSSGMKSKLGFAIATSIVPEILILDEVFAAGDANFRSKSEQRMKSIFEDSTTITVTHSINIVRAMTSRVIILDKGRLVYDGPTEAGIAHYGSL